MNTLHELVRQARLMTNKELATAIGGLTLLSTRAEAKQDEVIIRETIRRLRALKQ